MVVAGGDAVEMQDNEVEESEADIPVWRRYDGGWCPGK